MSEIASVLYQYADNFAFLVLSTIGLIVIFGMMGVINMAHGDFMMIGAYVTAGLYHFGVPFAVSLACATFAVGLVGLLIERLIIRRLYGQLLTSLVVTFGLSMIISQGFLFVFGPSMQSVPVPLGSFRFAGTSYSYYVIVLAGVAVGCLGLLWVVLNRTRFGIRARATIENPDMAAALGVNTARMYAFTFAIGSAFAGLAGGLFSAVAQLTPTFGQTYTVLAFITVVVGGGANVVTGLTSSGLSLGGIDTIVTNWFGTFPGLVGMMIAAMVIIRLAPDGLSGVLERRQRRSLR